MADRVKKIYFQGEFDAERIIQTVNKIQQQFNQLNLNKTNTKTFEKDFDSIVRKAQQLEVQIKQGFSSSRDVEKFSREMSSLESDFTKITTDMQRFVRNANFSDLDTSVFQKDLEKINSQITEASRSIFNLRKNLSGQIQNLATKTGVTSLGGETKSIAENLENSKEIENIQDRLIQKQNASLQREQQKVSETEQAITAQKQLNEQLIEELNLRKQNDPDNTLDATRKSLRGKLAAYDQKESLTPTEKGWQTRYRNQLSQIGKSTTEELTNESAEIDKKIKSLNNNLEKSNKEIKSITENVKNLNTFFSALSGQDVGNFQDDINEIQRTQVAINQAEKAYKSAKRAKEDYKNTRVQETTQEVNAASKAFEGLGNDAQKSQKGISAAAEEMSRMEKQAERFENMKQRLEAFFGATSMFYAFRRAVQSSYQAIKELDAAFTEIAVVTDMTNEELWDSFDTYNNMAQRLGATTVEAIQTSALYYQQGLDTVEVMELTEETIKMARIAGMDFAEATDRMTAALRGFKLEMSEASRVNDVFSALAAESAVDTDELSAALTRTASIAESAGMNLETTSAFLSQMIETTREAPENLGTAMKTIVARFQELKKDLDEVEVDGEIVDANKVETALRSVGITLRDELTGQFRDLDDVFLELSAKWDSLDRNTQRYIATIAAGSRQQSRFIAMMDNYERTMELINIAQNSSGASAAQFAKTLDSVETKLNNIQSSFEELIGTLVGSDIVKGILEGINNVLQVFNDIADQGPVVATLFTVAFVKSAKSILSSFLNSGKSLFTQIDNWIKQAQTKAEKSGNTALANFFASLNNQAKKSTIGETIKQKIESVTPTLKVNVVNAADGQPIATAQMGMTGNTKGTTQTTNNKKTGGAVSNKAGTWKYQTVNGRQQWIQQTGTTLNQTDQGATKTKGLLSKLGTGFSKVSGALNKFSGAITPLLNITSSVGLLANTQTQTGMKGALVGSTVGSAAGGLIGAFLGNPQLGAAIGNFAGTFLGPAIAKGIDNATYGIGSEENINKLTEIATEIGEKASETITENTEFTDLAEEYTELSEKVSLTNEEKERLIELNEQLIALDPELTTSFDTEINANAIVIEQLQERIRLKKEEAGLAGAQSEAATSLVNIAENQKQFVDDYKDSLNKTLQKIGKNRYGYNQKLSTYFDPFTPKQQEEYAEILKPLEDLLKEAGTDGKSVALSEFDINDPLIIGERGDQILAYLEARENIEGKIVNPEVKETIKEVQNGYQQFQEEIANELQKITSTTVSGAIDQAFVGVDSSSFAGQNRSLISEQLQDLFSQEQLKAILPEVDENGEISDEAKEQLERNIEEMYQFAVETSEKLVTITNQFSQEEQEAYTTAIQMYGALFAAGRTDIEEQISEYLNSIGISSGKIMGAISLMPEEYKNQLKENYSQIYTANRNFIDNILAQAEDGQYKINGALAAYQFANISMQIGEDEPAYQQAFQREYSNLLKNTNLTSDQISQAITAMGEADVTSSASMAKLSVKLRDIGLDVDEVTSLTYSMGSVFDRVGMNAEDALTNIENSLNSVNNLIDIISANIDGSISLDQLNKLNEILQENNQELLKSSQIVATGDGFQIKGGVEGIVGSGIQSQQQILLNQAEQAKAMQRLEEERAALYKEGSEEWIQHMQQAQQAESTSLFYLAGEAQIRANLAKQKAQEDNAEQKRLYDIVQQYKDMIAEMERYYNIQRKILQLQNEQKDFELDFQLAEGSDQAAEALRGQMLNLVEQQGLLRDAGAIYQKDMKALGDYINQDFGQYLTVDESGNIFQNTSELEKLAKQMIGASEAESEELQKKWDTINEVQTAYEEMYDTVISNSQEYKQNLIEQQKLEEEIRQYQIDLEKALRDMIIADMQAEVEAVKEKYDRIKEEDQKYLNSLQKNINKRKQLQQDQDQDEEIATLQNRINLLSRDTSGIYDKEVEQLQDELDQLLQEKSNTALDRLYEEEEAKTQKVADELTLRSEFLQQQLDLELETYAISNEKVAELLKLKDQEILDWMKKHSEEFRRATTTEQEHFINTWRTQIEQGKAAQQTLTDDLETQKIAILQKFNEIETGGINTYIAAVKRAANEKIVLNIDTNQIQTALKELNTLSEAQSKFMADESQKALDRLLTDIERAAAQGNKAEVQRLKAEYDSELALFNKYSTDVMKKGKYNRTYQNPLDLAESKGNISYATSQKGIVDNSIKAKSGNFELKSRGNETAFYWDSNGKRYTGELNNVKMSISKKEIRLKEGYRVQEAKYNGKTIYVPIQFMNKYPNSSEWVYSQYASGGLVDYTGPAWVDGTKTKPEAFLSSNDTQNIANFTDVLSRFIKTPKTSDDYAQNQNLGDTYYDFHITVEKLDEDYNAEQMMKDMEQYIVQKSKYRKVTNLSRSR